MISTKQISTGTSKEEQQTDGQGASSGVWVAPKVSLLSLAGTASGGSPSTTEDTTYSLLS